MFFVLFCFLAAKQGYKVGGGGGYTCPECCRVPEMWRDQCSYEPLVFIELRKYMIREEEEDINLITKPFFIPSVGHLRPPRDI